MAPYAVCNLGNLTPTSSGSSNTGAVGGLHDAESLTIYVTSSAGTASTGATPLAIQVSQFDPALTAPGGVTESTLFYLLRLTSTLAGLPVLTTGGAITIEAPAFRGLRLTNMTSAVAAEIVGYITKKIVV